MDNFTIRMAVESDTEGMMKNLRVMGQENASVPINFDKVRAVVDNAIKSQWAFVVEKQGNVVGCCALFLSEQWYSDTKIVSDYFFFVHPAHRSYAIATAMINACKAAAKIVGAPLVIGVMVKKDPIRKLKFFQRHMKPLGGFFISGV